MDPPEQALVEVGAAALAAPSAAVAGLVAASIAENTKRTYAAALKRLDAGLAGQDLTDASLALYLASLHAAGLSPAFDGKARAAAGARSTGCASAKSTPRPPASRTGRCFAACEGAAASKAIQGAGCRSTPSAESSAAGRPLPASRAGYPVIVSGLAARNRWPPAGPRFVEMQTAGRWQSPAMPGHYARGQLAARGAVARVRYGRG